MTMKWSDLSATNEYRSLSGDQQAKVRSGYFDTNVAPTIKDSSMLPQARAEWDRATLPRPQGQQSGLIPEERKAEGFGGALRSGAETTARALGTAAKTYRGDTEGVQQDFEKTQAIPRTPQQESFGQAVQDRAEISDDTLWDGIKNVAASAWEHPTGAAHEMAAQLPNSAVVLGSGYAGFKAGGAIGAMMGPAAPAAAPIMAVAGGILGMFLGNAGIETGFIAQEKAADGEVTADDLSEAKRQGAVKGGVITGIDTATMGANRFLFGAPGRAVEGAVSKTLADKGIDLTDGLAVRAALNNKDILAEATKSAEAAFSGAMTAGQRAGRGGAGLALESTAEGTGEYLGSLAAGLDASFTEAALEAMLSIPQSAVDIRISNKLDSPGTATVLAARTLGQHMSPDHAGILQSVDMPPRARMEAARQISQSMKADTPAMAQAFMDHAMQRISQGRPLIDEGEQGFYDALRALDQHKVQQEAKTLLALPAPQDMTHVPITVPPINASQVEGAGAIFGGGFEAQAPMSLRAEDMTAPNATQFVRAAKDRLEAAQADGDQQAVQRAAFELRAGLSAIESILAGNAEKARAELEKQHQEYVQRFKESAETPPLLPAPDTEGRHVIAGPDGGARFETQQEVEARDRQRVEAAEQFRQRAAEAPLGLPAPEGVDERGFRVTPDGEAMRETVQDIEARETGSRSPNADSDTQGGLSVRNDGQTLDTEQPASRIDAAANEAATSPASELPEPTEAQKEAGNYKKGKIAWNGLGISVENPKGSTRSGTDADGNAWSNTMGAHYGYIRKTEGNDGDQVDVFFGDNPESEKVFIIDQHADQGDGGAFDEHKVMVGFDSQEQAIQAYLDSYSSDWKVGPVTEDTVDGFKAWLESGDTKRPYASASESGAATQADIAAIQKSARAKEQARKRRQVNPDDSLVNAIIKLGGINPEWRQDITGDDKGNRNIPGVGYLFTPKGTSPDDMAVKLHEAGYLTDAQLADLDARDYLYGAIEGELSGRRAAYQLNSDRAQLAEMEAREEQYAAEMESAQAQREEVYAEIEAEHGPDAAAQARAHDDSADSTIDQLLQDREIHEQREAERDAILTDAAEAAGLEPLRGSGQEADSQPGTDSSPAAEDRGSPGPAVAGTEPAQVAPDGAVSASGDQEFSLQQETEADRQAREQREAEARRAEDSQRRSEERQEQSEREQAIDRQAATESVDRFELGQSADQQLSGQSDLLGESDALYSGYERETSNLQSRESDEAGVQEPSTDAGRSDQFDLFAPPEADTRQAYADLFGTIVKPRTVTRISSATDTIAEEGDLAHLLASIRKDPQEVFYAVATDNDGKVLRVMRYTRGTKDSASVYPIDVIAEAASIEGVDSLHLAHNHPSGSTNPSAADTNITNRIQSMLDGTGINPGYHVVVGKDAWGSVHSDAGRSGGPGGRLEPRARTQSIPVTERRFTKRGTLGEAVNSPQSALRLAEGHDNAIFLLNTQNHPVAIIPMSPAEMGALREGGRVSRILSAVNTSNASAAIVKSESRGAADNVTRMLSTYEGELRVLDALYPDGSGTVVSAANSGRVETFGPWFSRGREPVTNPHTADTLKAALDQAFPGVYGALEKAGLARTLTRDQLPEGVAPDARAYVQDGVITFLTDNISRDHDVKGLMLHEIGVHLRGLGQGDTDFQKTLGRFEQMRKMGGKKVVAAFDRVPEDTPSHLVTEEALGYYVEANPDLSFAQQVLSWFKGRLREWLGPVKSADRLAVMRWANTLIEADLVYMATAAMRGSREAVARPGEAVMASRQEAGVSAERYRNELRKAMTSLRSVVPPISLGKAPAVLQRLGAPALDLTITRDVVRKATNGVKHVVPMEVIESLPELMADPVAVFDGSQENSLALVVEAVDSEGDPVSVGVHLSARQGRVEVNKIATVHGKKDAGRQLMKWIREGKLRYVHTEKSRDLSMTSGVQFPGVSGSSRGLDGKVLTEADIVKADGGDIRYSRTADAFTDLDDDQKGFLNKTGRPPATLRAQDWLAERWNRAGTKIRQGMVDRYAALKEMDEKLHGKEFIDTAIHDSSWVLAKMSSAGSGALTAMMTAGRIRYNTKERVITLKDDDTSGGLTAVLSQVGSSAEVERFMGWIAANRADALMKEWVVVQGGKETRYKDEASAKAAASSIPGATAKPSPRENLFTPKEIAAGKRLNEGKTEDGRARPMVYAKAFAQFQQYRGDVLSIAEAAGIISAESRAMWKDEFYVPFYRVMAEDAAAKGPTGSKGLSRQEAYKRLKGGKENLNDLLENTLMNFHHLLSASLKNQAAVQSVKNAEKLGIAERVPESARDSETITFVLEGGERVFYEISDPMVYEAITMLADPGLNNFAVRSMGAFKRLLTQMVTITPQFIAANTLRDLMQATATTPTSKNIFKNFAQGIGAYRDAKTRAEMLASGGAFSFGHIYGMDASEVRASLNRTIKGAKLVSDRNMVPNIIKAGWRAWGEVTDTSENIARAASYTQNVEEMGQLRAAFEARDIMDFSQHGAWPATRFLIRVVPFLNARLQGLDKIYRSGVKPALMVAMGQGTQSDRQAAGRFAVVTGALALASLALYLANADDEEYQKLEEWQKDTYWFIRIGDQAFFLPKPFEVGAISTLVERTAQQFMDDKATGALFRERLGAMLMETFSFNPVPQMFQPALDVYANRDSFTGRAIETPGMERLSPGLRVRDTTTAPARVLSAASRVAGDDTPVSLSPVQAEHLINGYLGSVGASAAGLIDTIWRTASGKEAPDKRWHEYQPVRRFYRDLGAPAPYTRYSSLFYDGLREANRVYADVMELQKLGRQDRALELMEENRGVLALRQPLNQQQRLLTEVNQRIQQVRRSDKDGAWKRQELDRLMTMRNQITEQMGRRVEEVRAGG